MEDNKTAATAEKTETVTGAAGLTAAPASTEVKSGKSFRWLRKRELMELVQSQSARLAALEEQNRQLTEQLERREVIITESGSLAEACMRMNGVFEAAQNACDQYMENARKNADRLKEETEKECASLRESVMQECVNLRERTWQDCVDLREKTRQDCADLRERILEACEKQLRGITLMPDISELPAMKDIAFPKEDAIDAEVKEAAGEEAEAAHEDQAAD